MYKIHELCITAKPILEPLALQPIADPLDTAPLYQRVADRIANRIYDGHWRPGEPIPNEFALADEFAVLAHPQGARVTPEPDHESVLTRLANEHEQSSFELDSKDEVTVIERLRCVDGIRATSEHIVVPTQLFHGLATSPTSLPQALYPFYHQQYGIFVLRANEYISAIAADEQTATDLAVEPGSPTLQSRFRADLFQYNVNLN